MSYLTQGKVEDLLWTEALRYMRSMAGLLRRRGYVIPVHLCRNLLLDL